MRCPLPFLFRLSCRIHGFSIIRPSREAGLSLKLTEHTPKNDPVLGSVMFFVSETWPNWLNMARILDSVTVNGSNP